MVVVEMPQSKPVITGGHQELPGAPKMKYKPGDVLNLTCTSAPSNPPAQLEWRLNDKKVCKDWRLKKETKAYQRFLIEKVRFFFHSFTCIFSDYMAHDITKEF